ncbi:MAG: YebC/PmpR family DNA-binding transcriptional regulator [Verrucomicrobia bacterium]|nr:YebC/PmpR family DNA-binding transcriptional regulator [Verrucomicrobiota bacterium]
MAGHSKWANIKRRKEKVDAKRGKVFSRVAKEIITAVKQGGGGDPKMNARLKTAIERAKEVNFPQENIDRNIKKATSSDQGEYFDLTYEIYGHGGVGIVVEILTDNKNRTSSDMRIATNKRGGNIATPGSVLFQFDRKGVIRILKETMTEDALFMIALDCGVDEMETSDDEYILFTHVDDLLQVKQKLLEKGVKICEAEFEQIPKTLVEVDEENRKKNEDLIDWLENLDDVDTVFSNMA